MPPPADKPTDPITQAVRDLCQALSDAAFGPDPGPQYIFINPKRVISAAAGLTYAVDYAGTNVIISAVD